MKSIHKTVLLAIIIYSIFCRNSLFAAEVLLNDGSLIRGEIKKDKTYHIVLKIGNEIKGDAETDNLLAIPKTRIKSISYINETEKRNRLISPSHGIMSVLVWC